ncbi:MAG: metallophosphoesterase [Polyangiales bacterium]
MSEPAEGAAPSTPLSRPTPALMLALGLVGLFVVSMHVYFAQRLVLASALQKPWSTLACAALAAAAALLFVHPLVEHRFGPAAGGVTAWPAFLWLGCCFYLALGLGLSDLGLSLSGLHGSVVLRARAGVVCALVLLAAAVGVRSALRPPALRRIDLALPGWPAGLDGYRIVQISDVHIGALIRAPFLRSVVERCNARAPDLIAITGDLVDGSVEHYGQDVLPLAQLRARDGVLFVTGNHDHFSGVDPWLAQLETLGIAILRNRRVRIERAGAALEIAGVDDLGSARMGPGARHDLDAALRGWDGKSPLVLLAHDPRSFEQAKDRGSLLQLSGHTHGGQLWPFGAFVRLQTRFVAGLYRHGQSTLYVSRGTGFWGPPMRLFAPAEITEIVLHAG